MFTAFYQRGQMMMEVRASTPEGMRQKVEEIDRQLSKAEAAQKPNVSFQRAE